MAGHELAGDGRVWIDDRAWCCVVLVSVSTSARQRTEIPDFTTRRACPVSGHEIEFPTMRRRSSVFIELLKPRDVWIAFIAAAALDGGDNFALLSSCAVLFTRVKSRLVSGTFCRRFLRGVVAGVR